MDYSVLPFNSTLVYRFHYYSFWTAHAPYKNFIKRAGNVDRDLFLMISRLRSCV